MLQKKIIRFKNSEMRGNVAGKKSQHVQALRRVALDMGMHKPKQLAGVNASGLQAVAAPWQTNHAPRKLPRWMPTAPTNLEDGSVGNESDQRKAGHRHFILKLPQNTY